MRIFLKRYTGHVMTDKATAGPTELIKSPFLELCTGYFAYHLLSLYNICEFIYKDFPIVAHKIRVLLLREKLYIKIRSLFCIIYY